MYTQTRAYTHGRPRANGRPRTNRAYEGDAGEYRAESRALNRFPGTYGREAGGALSLLRHAGNPGNGNISLHIVPAGQVCVE